MQDTVLLIGHGSRRNDSNQEIYNFAAQWQQRNPQWHIEVCFIELADVLLDDGLRKAAQNSKRVIAVPLILNAAGHVKMEIPQHIAKARELYPDTTFHLTRHLGVSDAMLQLLQRQLAAVMKQMDQPDPHTTGIIILGRGSSEPSANGEMAKLARWLFEATDHPMVDIAFTGITFPRIEEAVYRQQKLDMRQIIILPYYLFSGVLIDRISRQHQTLGQQYPHIRFGLGTYFGFDDTIFSTLNQRVEQILHNSGDPQMLECDGCRFRALAEEHGHGHHHHDVADNHNHADHHADHDHSHHHSNHEHEHEQHHHAK